MKRDIEKLKSEQFDLLIIGGGSHGACAARDAALRGMKVALVDKGDICGATSHNSLKTIHGGIRYLQHLNFKRTLESIKEQKIWLRTAPHLVKPLPFLMPTYGHGMRGPLAMLAGITLFRMLGIGRNRALREDKKIPAGRLMSASKCLKRAPNIKTDKLTGGALWYDAQIEHADRAVMQVSQHAYELGSTICNYVEIDQLLIDQNKTIGAIAIDRLNGSSFTIKAKSVLNAAGPWASEVLSNTPELAINTSLVKSMNTTHFEFNGKADDLSIENQEILSFVDEINLAYPSLKLKPDDVLYCYQGLAPAGEEHQQKETEASSENALRLHESKVIDHSKMHQLEGLVSIFSIKWTTSRLIAKQAVDLIAEKLGNKTPCSTHIEPIVDKLELPFLTAELSDAELESFCEQTHD